jgi:hypothetical protein
MIRIRVSAVVIAAAIAASTLTSPASAQAFSTSWGTGNVQATHYDANGRLVFDSVSQGSAVANDRGLSAFASSPIHDKGLSGAVTVPGGSVGYNELLATH